MRPCFYVGAGLGVALEKTFLDVARAQDPFELAVALLLLLVTLSGIAAMFEMVRTHA